MQAAKPRSNIGGAVLYLTRPRVVFGFMSRPLPIATVNRSQTRPSPPGIFIRYDGVGLVTKRIEIIPSTTPQMLSISSKNVSYSIYQRRIGEVHIVGRVV